MSFAGRGRGSAAAGRSQNLGSDQQAPVRRSAREPVPSSRLRPEEYEVYRAVQPGPSASRQAPTDFANREISTRPTAENFYSTLPGASRRQGPAVNRPENRLSFQERGQTRSGGRFAARNLPYFSSLRELLSHHQRLLDPGPVVSTRYARIGRGTLLQTCIRFRSDHSDIRGSLNRVLTELFQELEFENRAGEALEVSITFNAVLSNRASTSFSIFFGQNYGEGSPPSRLGFSARPVVIRNLLHLRRIPTEFDLEDLIRRFSLAFDSSDLVVAKILNVVYLVHQVRLPAGS